MAGNKNSGRRMGFRHTQDVRDKIRATMIVNRLSDHVAGKVDMGATQVSAALGLLRKCVPDLQATELTGSEGGPITYSWQDQDK
jgi:hypothetical protein